MRYIHAMPIAGKDLPIGLLSSYAMDSLPLLPAATAEGNNLTGYAALACDQNGTLLCSRRPVNLCPCAILGTINWPQLGYDISVAESGATEVTTNASAVTSINTARDWGTEEKNRLYAIYDGPASGDYYPRIKRTKILPANLISALPENSPRASTFNRSLGGQKETFYAIPRNYADHRIKITRREYPGLLLSFPLIGVETVRLSIVYESTLDGSNMHPSGTMEVPLRAAFAPIKADSRLFAWPSSVEFDADEVAGYGSGIVPTTTLSLAHTHYALGKATGTAAFDITVPASGLGIFWVELDPWQYITFASKMIRSDRTDEHWQDLEFLAKIYHAAAI